MDRKLFMAIERAEQELTEASDFEQAILALSKHDAATLVLTSALRNAVAHSEVIWQKIEEMPEFKACYTDRDHAYQDFLREYFSKT